MIALVEVLLFDARDRVPHLCGDGGPLKEREREINVKKEKRPYEKQ